MDYPTAYTTIRRTTNRNNPHTGLAEHYEGHAERSEPNKNLYSEQPQKGLELLKHRIVSTCSRTSVSHHPHTLQRKSQLHGIHLKHRPFRGSATGEAPEAAMVSGTMKHFHMAQRAFLTYPRKYYSSRPSIMIISYFNAHTQGFLLHFIRHILIGKA